MRRCGYCSSSFDSTGQGTPAKYCSRRCKERARERRKRDALIAQRPCAHCGEVLGRQRAGGRGRHPIYHLDCADVVERRQIQEHAERRGRRVGLDLRTGMVNETNTKPLNRAYLATLRADPCAYCGSPTGGEIDHIVPCQSIGRRSIQEPGNLTGACAACNNAKRATPLLSHLLAAAVRREMRPLAEELECISGQRYWVRPARGGSRQTAEVLAG